MCDLRRIGKGILLGGALSFVVNAGWWVYAFILLGQFSKALKGVG